MSVGFNCALGANLLQPHLETIASKTDVAISAHPNAGLPNAFGEYDETPYEMALQIDYWGMLWNNTSSYFSYCRVS